MKEPPSDKKPRPLAQYAHFDWEGFTDRFRGSRSEILARLEEYLPHLRGRSLPIVEIGSGRGEFLELAQSNGIEAIGIESHSAFVRQCQARGLNVRNGDGLEYLYDQPEESLGGLVAIQVVEHLSFEQLCTLVNLGRERLAPGAPLILETVNPYNVDARGHFWLDPSHHCPIHPELLQYMAESAGYSVAEIHYPGEQDFVRRRWLKRQRFNPLYWLKNGFGRKPSQASTPLLQLTQGMHFLDYYLLAKK